MSLVPYSDDVGGTKKVWVTPTLIIVTTIVYIVQFILEFKKGFESDLIINAGAIYPKYFFTTPLENIYRLITVEFLHASPYHLIINMCFLNAFGKTIEKILGSGLFLAAYLLLGCFGSLVDIILHSNSQIPRVGASGSISAIMGIYIILASWARIKMNIMVPGYMSSGQSIAFYVPSWLIIAIYMIFGVISLFFGGADASDIHISCFLAGIALGYYLSDREWIQDNIDDLQTHPGWLQD